jgi:hypothetical protein
MVLIAGVPLCLLPRRKQGKERSSRTSEQAAARLFVPTCMPQSQTDDPLRAAERDAWLIAGGKPRE